MYMLLAMWREDSESVVGSDWFVFGCSSFGTLLSVCFSSEFTFPERNEQ